jgi:hypothetical protein
MRCLALAFLAALATYGTLTYSPKKTAAELPLPSTGLYVNGEFVPGHFEPTTSQNGTIGYRFVPDQKPVD